MSKLLHKLTNQIPHLMTLSGTMDSLDELTEREFVILAGGIIDATIGQAVISSLPENDEKVVEALTRADGPISTFAQKITLARALGLLNVEMANDLSILKKIRNHFAHGIITAPIEDDPISTLTSDLLVAANYDACIRFVAGALEGEVGEITREAGVFVNDKWIGGDRYNLLTGRVAGRDGGAVLAYIKRPDLEDHTTSRGRLIAGLRAVWMTLMPYGVFKLSEKHAAAL